MRYFWGTMVVLLMACTLHAQDRPAPPRSVPAGGSSRGEADTSPRSRALDEKRRRSMEMFVRGMAVQRQGRLGDSAALFKKAISVNPNSSFAYGGLADTYSRMGRWEDSVKVYRTLMYDWPGKGWSSSHANDYEHLIRFAGALHNSGEMREAEAVYRKAAGFAPSRMRPYLYIPDGSRAFDRKKMKASLQLAVADAAERRIRAGGKANLHANIRRWVDESRKAVAVAPDYGPAHLMVGKALEYQSHCDSFYKVKGEGRAPKAGALKSYKRALALGDSRTKAQAQKAMESYWFNDVAATSP